MRNGLKISNLKHYSFLCYFFILSGAFYLTGFIYDDDNPCQIKVEKAFGLVSNVKLYPVDGGEVVELKERVFVVEYTGNFVTLHLEGIPAKEYDRINMEFYTPGQEEMTAVADLNDNTTERNSLIVYGTFRGKPFTYRSNVNGGKIIPFKNNLVSAGGSQTIQFEINPVKWFSGPSEQFSPYEPTNQGTIDKNIKLSFDTAIAAD